MAFTLAQLQAEFATDGPVCVVTRFDAAGTSTDVYIQNLNINSARKAGWTQVAQSNTAAQAATAIRANLT